jgi:hypothetical protein
MSVIYNFDISESTSDFEQIFISTDYPGDLLNHSLQVYKWCPTKKENEVALEYDFTERSVFRVIDSKCPSISSWTLSTLKIMQLIFF